MKKIIVSFLLSFLITMFLFFLVAALIWFMIFLKHPLILIIGYLAFSIPIILFWLANKVRNKYLSVLCSILSGGLCGFYAFGTVYIIGQFW